MIPKLSDANIERFRRLYAKRGWLERVRGADERFEILDDIARSGEVAAISSLLHFFVSNDRPLATSCARTMYRLFRTVALDDLAELDENIRLGSWSSWNVSEFTVARGPKDARYLATFGELSIFLSGIFSCHADGYTREASIRALANCETGEELPFLLLRVNDWVENVRVVAGELLSGRIREDYVPHFVRALPLVLRLQRTRRQDHRPTLSRIQSLLAAPSASSAIEEGMGSSDGTTRRFCYGIALSNNDPRRLATVARHAFEDANFRISLDALNAIARISPSTELKQLVDLAMQSPVGGVRLAALRVVIEKYPESADAECRNALLDGNSGVRQQAQFQLQKSGSLDVCSYYAKILSHATPRALPNVIASIGETCSKSQIVLLEPYLFSARSLVRMRAYRSLAQLDHEHQVGDFLRALADESTRVVRVAALFLRKRVNLVGGERIWEIHTRLANPRHRKWTLFLVAGLTKWDSCFYLIRGLNDVDAEASICARKHLECG